MSYRPKLDQNPQIVFALWDGQEVDVLGISMIFCGWPGSSTVYITNVDDDGVAFAHAMDDYMSGKLGSSLCPIYSEYYKHVRQGPVGSVISKCQFTRQELVDLLVSKNYYVG